MTYRLIFSVALCTIALGAAGGNQPSLRILQHQDHFDGAGCSFRVVGSPAERSDVFQWNLSNDEGWINVSGSDVRLKLLSSQRIPLRKDKASVGDRQLLEFAGGGLKVTVRTRTTRVCPENDESCEVWSEEGVIEVVAGKRSWTARVKGECGS
jgi:hypothetical protein